MIFNDFCDQELIYHTGAEVLGRELDRIECRVMCACSNQGYDVIDVHHHPVLLQVRRHGKVEASFVARCCHRPIKACPHRLPLRDFTLEGTLGAACAGVLAADALTGLLL